MRVLVACEESQTVTKEFRNLGYEAYNCDIIPCSGGHPEWHYQQDVTELLQLEWDLIIAHPPCTYLTISNNRAMVNGCKTYTAEEGKILRQDAIDFFMQFANAKCERIAIENPIGIMSTQYKKPSQIIHPWQFGHEASKATCLWLKGLPLLKPTNIVSKGEFFEWVDAKTGKVKRQAAWDMEALKLPRAERSKVRSKTFQGIAEAMALQWGGFNGH